MDEPDLHVVPGLSAAACLREGLDLTSDVVLVHNDLLSCGPLRPFDSVAAWRDLRQVYLRSLDVENPTFAFDEQEADVLTNHERLASAGTITLSLGTGLPEQLLLVWFVALLRHLAIDPARCRVIQFGPNRSGEIVGVGVLNPSQFKQRPEPVRLNAAAVRELESAWAAVTASAPDALLAFLSERDHSLPFVRRSLLALLHHYPDRSTGLNAFEHQLLQDVREFGPKANRVVGSTMGHDFEFPEWMADAYLFERLRRLGDSTLPRPLLTLSGDMRTLRGTAVHLTRHGEDVLAGKANAVDWNGIEDWIAGVHLDSRSGRVWFHEKDTLVRRV